ncbi:MAG TPA: hypothetical protein VND80_10550 [Steroidobacteraceae bacterium]|nr:hypothetical protein [Steroidobacteraceae bacterium]
MKAAHGPWRSVDLAIDANHAAYAGHFPGRPILPGVVLLDAALHALATEGLLDPARCRVASCKFSSPVRPSDRVVLELSATANGSIRLRFSAGGRAVASGVVTPCDRDEAR